jgi:cytochrome c-type biogenesis protein CcmH/NrfG
MTDEHARQNDSIAMALRTYAQNVLILVFGLLPLFCIPTIVAPFDYTKVSIAVVSVFVALVLYSLSVLRSGVVSLGVSYPLCALWLVAIVSLASSFLSGDLKDSLIGDLFSVHATVFVAILALIPTVWVLLRPTKVSVLKLYILLAASTLIIVVFHVARLIFGPEFLSFSIFTTPTASPVGSWNDLALFLGLAIILSLIALEQLTLTRIGRILFMAVCIGALAMLGVINFFLVWLILGLTSLAMVVYSLGKDRFTGGQLPLISSASGVNSLPIALIVFAVSVLFVVGGPTLGGWLTKYTGVSYVEVRPSLQATADIARNVYTENALLGIGANKFTDAWRLYKDTSINTTPFWNTDFNAGNSYISTFFVTTGVLGGATWILFFLVYGVLGIRRLLGPTSADKIWYFIGVSSFVSAVYVWGISMMYVPGVVILLLGSLCTGVSLYAFNELGESHARPIIIGTNRRTGFVLTLGVIVIIIGSVSMLYVAGRHYTSVYVFNESVREMQSGKDIAELERTVLSAYQLSSSDIFARRIAEYQFTRMNNLLRETSLTSEQQAEFERTSATGVQAALTAVEKDRLEPNNWGVLGGIYGILALVGVEGAQERALEALTKSRELNPKNPLPYLEIAVVQARAGLLDQSRESIQQAINLKPNYTEAFFLLSQIETMQGNIGGAIASTQATLQLEPQNAARYYQLGVLLTANKNIDDAILSFEKAIDIDQNYANARYLLALAYDEKGRSGDARAQLEKVLELNPGNQEVIDLIQVIINEGSLSRLRTGASRTVTESIPVTNENGTVSTTQETDSPLVTPVNTIPSSPDESEGKTE